MYTGSNVSKEDTVNVRITNEKQQKVKKTLSQHFNSYSSILYSFSWNVTYFMIYIRSMVKKALT
jgi:CRISPR/Cas system-associated endonuclease Cas3-HD